MERDVMSEGNEKRFRTLFISDVHLGARGSQADRLLDFLRTHDADTIYLVGDIVDGWALKSGWHWPQSHNDFVQKMLRKVRKGAKVDVGDKQGVKALFVAFTHHVSFHVEQLTDLHDTAMTIYAASAAAVRSKVTNV